MHVTASNTTIDAQHAAMGFAALKQVIESSQQQRCGDLLPQQQPVTDQLNARSVACSTLGFQRKCLS